MEQLSSPPLLSSTTSECSVATEADKNRQRKEERLNRKHQKELSGINVGHWNTREKRLYYLFLSDHSEQFIRTELRRSDKIFRAMAIYVGTRAPDQCRSHHQKM